MIFFTKKRGIKFNADALPEWCTSYTKEVKPIRKDLIEKLAERCWIELEYDNVENERTEEVDYELIVECVLRHWLVEVLKCFGQ